MEKLASSFKIARGTVAPRRMVMAAGILLGWNLALSMPAGSTEWVETFADDLSSDCSRAYSMTAACWEFHRKDGTGSYSVQNGRLLATFGPCPHNGRSLYFWPRGVLEGDVTVEVEARLPDEGKLVVFAQGDNQGRGYRGILHPDGDLELYRLDNREEVLLASTALDDLTRAWSVHLELQTVGDRILLAAWNCGTSDRAPRLAAVDATYHSGNAGAGIRHPGYGEYGEFDSIRIAAASDPAVATITGTDTFVRSDCNSDGAVDVSDAICMLSWLFDGAVTPACLAAVNSNGDEAIDIADPITLLNYLFAGGPAPAPPFPDCGPSTLPVDKELGCAIPPNC